MKKTLLLSVLIIAAVALMAQEQKEVVTGADYADDVYYSLENGSDTTVARDNWDIAFAVPPMSLGVSILANTSSEVEVYTYTSSDTTVSDTAWATVDTTGMEWSAMYNSLETFSEGAFSAYATEHPDYGWGIYGGMGIITGQSLYIIKTVSGVYKKLAIIQRNAAQNLWEFKYANLDGSDEQVVSINTGTYSSNFVFYSIDNMEELDREPATADWDLLFTKYTDMIQMGPGAPVPYPVTGIFTNEDHMVAQEVREEGLDRPTFVEYQDTAFSSNISIIGSDWKSFNMGTFSYDIDTTVVYFLKKYGETDSTGMKAAGTDSTYYKIYFTDFTGSSDGKYTFIQEKLSAVSTRNPGVIQMLQVYPNPASEYINVVFDYTGETAIQIIDMTGRTIQSTIHNGGGFTSLSLDIARLNPGLFFLKVNTGDETGVLRFIKE